MKITFLGTRGYIEAKSPRHARHTALLVTHRRRRVMIDCGEDWRGALDEVRPHAIVVTHAHPDHALGLDRGAPCPVHATAATWRAIGRYPIAEQRHVEPRRPVRIEGIEFEAFPVAHSISAPAVGYRIGGTALFYVPDLVYIHDRAEALAGIRLYVGDAATLTRSFVRKRGDVLIGHTPVRTQLTWCRDAGIGRAIFTHCGSEIVAGDETRIEAQLAEMARQRGVDASLAYDGMELRLR